MRCPVPGQGSGGLVSEEWPRGSSVWEEGPLSFPFLRWRSPVGGSELPELRQTQTNT